VAGAAALVGAIIAKLRCVLRTGGEEGCDAGCGFTDQPLFPPGSSADCTAAPHVPVGRSVST